MSYNTLSLRRILRSDVIVIIMIIFFIVTIQYIWVLAAGLLFGDINTPSVAIITRANLKDSDGDTLPDLIEGTEENPCERGEIIPFPEDYERREGERTNLGTCTGTDPFDKDTDNDGFTDNAEDSLGSNPTLWIDPGFIWIFWSISILGYIIYRIRDKPTIKEYEKFEEFVQSQGVKSKSGTFAYGKGGSIFAKRSEEMSKDEKKEMIKQDPRYQRMIADEVEEPEISRKTRLKFFLQKNWWKLLLSAIIAIIIRWVLIQI